MTYHNHWSKSQPFAEGISGELCSWQPGLRQHDIRHLSWFRLRIDLSFTDLYAITDLNLWSRYGVYFSCSYHTEIYQARRYRVRWISIDLIWSVVQR